MADTMYSLSDAHMDHLLRQVEQKYGISILGHPDRLRWFLGDFQRACQAQQKAELMAGASERLKTAHLEGGNG